MVHHLEQQRREDMVEGMHVQMTWKEISNQVRIFAQNRSYVEFHLFELFPYFWYVALLALSKLNVYAW